MPKRKRPSLSPPSADDPSSNRTLNHQKKLCDQRITAAHKSLVSALRLGAGFERQKYSRRRKTAKERNDEKAVTRLDAEYAVLKALDIAKLAEQHLRKTIAKVKSIKDHEALPDNVREIEKGSHDPATLNVTARLYKVPGVRKVVDELIEDLKEIVGSNSRPEKVDNKSKEDGRKKTKVERDETAEDWGDADLESFAALDMRIAAPSSAEGDSDDSLSEGHRPPSVEDSGSEDDEETMVEEEEMEHIGDSDGDLSFHKARVGPRSSEKMNSADSQSEDESEAEFTHSDYDSEAAIPRGGYIVTDEGDDNSLEESPSGDESADEPTRPAEAKSKEETREKAKEKSKGKSKIKSKVLEQKPSKSTFLPSLSHAGYYSGTESEASDLDIDVAPKKNRRGQRARQKIWEQKYGEKAKHVQQVDRNSGWDPKRGAVSDDRTGRGGRPKTGRGPERTGDNLIELGPKKVKTRDDTGSLHPSWLAAKAAKEKKVTAKPQGTKIVFD